ncbi:probable LRR receptor-like serine/threonine-protein kinase At3g47570 isoform X2 [Amaranthus tricolor]|uniref:probable LRR receptor-like serine/threonine-protein kinase At3g47570 isoform X2 n=1 Tax=Amaranthus tricolor TaxID=29722 RepID=UPI00258BB188|nr:probable LRR receptor-like serine/threonine-protein kinase At3g47570 isoform X2 [Amaranthus tricolor]
MSSSFCWIIIVTSMFCSFQLCVAGNNETDRQALLEFKAKITGDPFSVLSSWNDTLHYCNWHGVTCGHMHQRVTYLDLPSLQFTGIISPYVGNLSFLRGLRLHNNSFGGILPPEIGRLHRLQYLFIRNNSIGGGIPSNISGCSSLIALDIFGNKLIEQIPPQLGVLPHLKFIFLSYNNVTGSIPSSMGNLTSLSRLYMDFTNLVGNIPSTFGKLKNLTVFSLSGYKLSGTVPPSVFNLSLLNHLDIGLNYFEGTLPPYLGNTLPLLQWFSIDSNRFTGAIPSSISNSSNLQVLLLADNNLQGQVPSLHKLAMLKRLTLYDNSLGDGQAGDLDFVSSLANATLLQFFEIGHNNFHGVFPRGLCNFSMVKTMSFYSNNIFGDIPNCIEDLTELQSLGAFDNALSGAIPQGIGKLQKLNKLFLNANKLTGPLPPSIGNLNQLTVFTLSNNSLEGQIPTTLENCTSLIGLNFSHNNLSGGIPPQLFSLPTLAILDLSANHLTKPLPEEVGQLNALQILDVSQNMLSGQIPISLSSCLSLESLNMSNNKIQGPIPDELKNLTGLSSLDLSYNNLSGKIPKYLASMQLQQLDLSHNNFEGEVPIGGIFNHTNAGFKSGNSKLCGGIPELELPHCSFSSNAEKRRSKHKRNLIIAILSGFLMVILLVASLMLFFCRQRKRSKETATYSDEGNFPNLSYQALFKATNGFSSENWIGSGTFRIVYKGIIDENGSTVAIKMFNLEYHGASRSFMAECDVLRRIRHRNLIKIIKACSSIDYKGRDFKALVYEYMENGSLEDWLHPTKPVDRDDTSRNLNLHQRIDIAIDIAFALDYLHNSCDTSIVHCDLKPSNVLLDDEMVAHVGDFGLARFLQNSISNADANPSNSVGVRGTVGYTPPEYGLGNEVSTHGDVYSFGVLLLEMFTGKRPTHEMFIGSFRLQDYVKENLPENVSQIIDHDVLKDIKREDVVKSLEALTSILAIALSCSTDVPHQRLDMSDVTTKLLSIRKKLLGNHLRRERIIQTGAR